MSLQDDINSLKDQIEHEEQSAKTIQQEIADEQRTSSQKINTWQQQAQAHQNAAQRMQQDLAVKQQELAREIEAAEREQKKQNEQKDIAKRMAGGLF